MALFEVNELKTNQQTTKEGIYRKFTYGARMCVDKFSQIICASQQTTQHPKATKQVVVQVNTNTLMTISSVYSF